LDDKIMSLFDPGFCSEDELHQAGFKSIGTNVQIDRGCTIIGADNISIGDHVRIDSFCSLIAADGCLDIGSYVHIGAHSHMLASGGISIGDFISISQGVKIYSRSDDYSGGYLNGPMVPHEYTGAVEKAVSIARHSLVGCNTVVLPGVEICEGTSVGAQSLVTGNLDEWSVYAGCPAKKIKERSRDILKHEESMRERGLYARRSDD
jgi:acetyltransferase-like isoleucine patch superfamily enzyme